MTATVAVLAYVALVVCCTFAAGDLVLRGQMGDRYLRAAGTVVGDRDNLAVEYRDGDGQLRRHELPGSDAEYYPTGSREDIWYDPATGDEFVASDTPLGSAVPSGIGAAVALVLLVGAVRVAGSARRVLLTAAAARDFGAPQRLSSAWSTVALAAAAALVAVGAYLAVRPRASGDVEFGVGLALAVVLGGAVVTHLRAVKATLPASAYSPRDDYDPDELSPDAVPVEVWRTPTSSRYWVSINDAESGSPAVFVPADLETALTVAAEYALELDRPPRVGEPLSVRLYGERFRTPPAHGPDLLKRERLVRLDEVDGLGSTWGEFRPGWARWARGLLAVVIAVAGVIRLVREEWLLPDDGQAVTPLLVGLAGLAAGLLVLSRPRTRVDEFTIDHRRFGRTRSVSWDDVLDVHFERDRVLLLGPEPKLVLPLWPADGPRGQVLLDVLLEARHRRSASRSDAWEVTGTYQ